jgi:hypothetical protein
VAGAETRANLTVIYLSMKCLCSITTLNSLWTLIFLSVSAYDCEAKDEPSQTNSLKRIMYRVQAGMPDSNGWYIAESTGGNFKIKFPAPFNDFEVSGIDENGQKQENHMVGTITKENTKYSATLSVKESPVEKNFLEDFLTGFKRNGTLLDSRQLQVLGHTAIEAEQGNNTRGAVMRMIVAGKNVYLLIAEFDSDKKDSLTQQIKTFMDSFEIKAGNWGMK